MSNDVLLEDVKKEISKGTYLTTKIISDLLKNNDSQIIKAKFEELQIENNELKNIIIKLQAKIIELLSNQI